MHRSTLGAFAKDGVYYKEVQDIKAKDKVLALNEKTGEERYSVVKQTFIRQADRIYQLTYEDGTLIETTWSHPFYVRGKGWVKAEDLVEGDVSQTEGNGSLKITKIHVDVRGEEVYNFEVEEDHNCYVSEAGVLVHNLNPDHYIASEILRLLPDWLKNAQDEWTDKDQKELQERREKQSLWATRILLDPCAGRENCVEFPINPLAMGPFLLKKGIKKGIRKLIPDRYKTAVPGRGKLALGRKADGTTLGRNMIEAGDVPDSFENVAAHHIVLGGHNSEFAQESRDILRQFKVDINDPKNGVWLPRNSKSANPRNANVHQPLHTDLYMQRLNDRLRAAESRDDVLKILDTYRHRLQSGQFKKGIDY